MEARIESRAPGTLACPRRALGLRWPSESVLHPCQRPTVERRQEWGGFHRVSDLLTLGVTRREHATTEDSAGQRLFA